MVTPGHPRGRGAAIALLAVVGLVAVAVLGWGALALPGRSTASTPAGPASVAVPTPDPTTTAAPSRTATAVVDEFLRALGEREAARAAAVTDAPAAAGTAIDRTLQGMESTGLRATRRTAVSAAGGVPVDLIWTVPGPAVWSYTVDLRLRRGEGGWLVHWAPGLLHPRLTDGQALAFHPVPAAGGLLDRTGTPFPQSGPRPQIVRDLQRAFPQDGTTGWRIVAVDSRGTERAVLRDEPPRGRRVTLTLDPHLQAAADAAVARQTRPALLVALRPSTGELLAVARNEAVTGPGALSARFPAGSTFKIVTAAAVLAQGTATPDTAVACPSTLTIGSRTVRNDGFGVDRLPLHTAFARSCNTTFAQLGSRLPPGALTRTSAQLGIGRTLHGNGVDIDTGSVPVPGSPVEQIEDSFGQGRVSVTPVGMAVAAATVSAGRTVVPFLVRGTPRPASVQAPDPAVLRAVRAMMREVVTGGTATSLNRLGPVAGKTGTAEVGSGPAHGWFVGFRGDLAFAAVVESAGSSGPALDLTASFLAGR